MQKLLITILIITNSISLSHAMQNASYFNNLLQAKQYEQAELLMEQNKSFVPAGHSLDESLELLKNSPVEKHKSILNKICTRTDAGPNFNSYERLGIFFSCVQKGYRNFTFIFESGIFNTLYRKQFSARLFRYT